MKLSNGAITSFVDEYRNYYSQVLDGKLAEEKAIELLKFMKLLYQPVLVTDRAKLEFYSVKKTESGCT